MCALSYQWAVSSGRKKRWKYMRPVDIDSALFTSYDKTFSLFFFLPFFLFSAAYREART